MAKKITLEQKKKAVKIAIDGGDPIKYLQECGSSNPVNMWYTIKASLKRTDPETYAKVPDQRKNGAKKRDEPTVQDDDDDPDPEPSILMAKTPIDDTVHIEARKITKPVNYDGFDVCGIRGNFGTYSTCIVSGKHWIDFEDPTGDTLSYPVDDWKNFLVELRRAAAVLGVEL